VDFAALPGEVPRTVLVATDGPTAAAARLITTLARDAAPAMAWHGVDLPRWAGPADALLVASLDGHHPRLAELVSSAGHRGLAVAAVAPPNSPVASAAARQTFAPLTADLHPRCARWAVQTPLLQALEALQVLQFPLHLDAVADALDEMAAMCRPGGDLFTNPAKALAAEFADSYPVVVGAGPLAGSAARTVAETLQLCGGVPAAAVALPDGVGRAGALLRGSGGLGGDEDDFFRDRIDEPSRPRARLVVIGDDGNPTDPPVGPRSDASVQLDDIAGRRAAAALRRVAEDFGVRTSDVETAAGPALARFAAAVAFGDFTAAYLAFGVGIDPGMPAPAEFGH
jgi:hypothetical protein